MTISKSLAPALCALLIVGCGDDDVNEANYTAPLEYEFSSRTNADFGSSVSSKISVVHTLMVNELIEFINSSDVSGLASGASALLRIKQVFEVGTITPDEGLDTSLGHTNIYTGQVATPTPINFFAGQPLLQENFADLIDSPRNISTSLSRFVSSSSRALPFTKLAELDLSGTVVDIVVGDFIGWPLLGDAINGNNMPLKLLNEWFEEVSVLMTDEDLSTSTISSNGIHLDELIYNLTLGSVHYSSISQFNLVSSKGLLKQNAEAFNLNEVEIQLSEVKSAEDAVNRAQDLVSASKITLEKSLIEWQKKDAKADPLLGLEYYQDLPLYGPLSLAETYFSLVEQVIIREKNNVSAVEGLAKAEGEVDPLQPYTDLENNWDEAFGYFGAARSYGLRNDSEISTKSYYDDFAADGVIDAFTEVNFGYAILASKRDAGAALANTDFSGNIWNAFLMGRQIIQQNHGREAIEDVGYHNELKAQADIIIENLEKVIAASVIHNINATIADINSVLGESEVVPEGVDLSEFDSVSFSYYKNWSKLKGMALTLQFNDNPTISKENLVKVHELIGELPRPGESLTEEVVDAGEEAAPIVNNYAARRYDLKTARDIIRDTYGFAEANAAAW